MTVWKTEGVVARKKLRIAMLGHKRIPARKGGYASPLDFTGFLVYTDREIPWTRIIEHKWFEFGKDEEGNDLPKTIISREYSSEWKPGDEPYYPVNDEKSGALYVEYKKLADAEDKVIFDGRLGEYRYYDMDATIVSVLEKCEEVLV